MNSVEKIIVAIDGPAGSGKSTTAKLVAKALGLIYIDTGAMYRAAALKALKAGCKIDDVEKISKTIKNIKIRFERINDEQHIFLNGDDVSEEIRTPEITNASSPISAIPFVREVMVEMQRKMGQDGGVVMEGRDIGSVVFPNADFKFFLIASLGERAKRRYTEMQKKGMNVDLYGIEKEILARDVRDSSRNNSPLVKAKEAIEIDTTNLTIDDQVEKILAVIREKLKD